MTNKVPALNLAGNETFLSFLLKSGLRVGAMGDEVCLGKGFLNVDTGRNGEVPENWLWSPGLARHALLLDMQSLWAVESQTVN